MSIAAERSRDVRARMTGLGDRRSVSPGGGPGEAAGRRWSDKIGNNFKSGIIRGLANGAAVREDFVEGEGVF